MVNQLLLLHGIVNDSTFLSQVTNYSTDTGINRARKFAAGHEYPLAQYNLNQSLTGSFSSTQIKTILDLTGINIYDMSAENTDIYFKSAEDGASRQGNAEEVHHRYRAAKAVLVPQSISASQDSDLSEITCALYYLYDGTNAPLVYAGTVAVDGTSAHGEGYGMGPIELNTTALNGVSSWTLDFNIGLKVRSSDGDHYPSWLSVESIAPTLRFSCYRESIGAYTIGGTAGTAVEVWLRAKGKTGPIANGTSSHIKFTGTASAIYPDSMSGGNNDDAMSSVVVEMIGADSSTAPLSVNTATTIA